MWWWMDGSVVDDGWMDGLVVGGWLAGWVCGWMGGWIDILQKTENTSLCRITIASLLVAVVCLWLAWG